MEFLQLLLIAVGLSMDAFAVSVCKGLATKEIKIKHYFIVGLWFGGFQGLMPVIGYFIGQTFVKYINNIDHWIAFGILALIGINMIKESFEKDKELDSSFSFKKMIILAIATSIDALTVGVSFSCAGISNIWIAASLILITTFILSAIGLGIGRKVGTKFSSKAQIAGGIILILIGLKVLLEHLGLINF